MAAVAGVDVSKDSLDVSVSEGPVLRFDNSAKGITKLLKHLAEQEATLAVCESTGGYERLLVSRLHKAELAVRVANPSRVRAFARACGYEAKTDPRDAQVLSRYRNLEAIPDDASQWDVRPRGAVTLAATLAGHREEAALYKRLATLRTDVPISEELSDLEWGGVPRGQFTALCEELGMTGLVDLPHRWAD